MSDERKPKIENLELNQETIWDLTELGPEKAERVKGGGYCLSDPAGPVSKLQACRTQNGCGVTC